MAQLQNQIYLSENSSQLLIYQNSKNVGGYDAVTFECYSTTTQQEPYLFTCCKDTLYLLDWSAPGIINYYVTETESITYSSKFDQVHYYDSLGFKNIGSEYCNLSWDIEILSTDSIKKETPCDIYQLYETKYFLWAVGDYGKLVMDTLSYYSDLQYTTKEQIIDGIQFMEHIIQLRAGLDIVIYRKINIELGIEKLCMEDTDGHRELVHIMNSASLPNILKSTKFLCKN